MSFIHGPDLYNEVDAKIIPELLDSAAMGLSRFHSAHGHYPQVEGKYFLDSIKEYVNINDAYVYADSLGRQGDTVLVKKPIGRMFDYKIVNHTYIGVGIPELTIIYRHIAPDSFLLYSVGKNLVDERGKGDDIIYRGGRKERF